MDKWAIFFNVILPTPFLLGYAWRIFKEIEREIDIFTRQSRRNRRTYR